MAELSPVARALLETIAGPESAGDYNVIYGGSQFDDYADHPRQPVLITSGPNKGKYSTAAGKYQFLGSTWDEQAEKLGLSDFSPASQDAAAWNLAVEEYRRDTGRDLEADLAAGDLSRVAPSLRNQWTSLPGGIEQGINGSAFANAYTSNLGPRLPPIGPAGGPALSAINAAAPPTQRKPPGIMAAAWQGLTGGLGNVAQMAGQKAAPVMRAAQSPGVAPAIMKAALGTVAGRTALIDPIIANAMNGSGGYGQSMPRAGQTIMTENNGRQTIGERLNGSSKGYTVSNSDYFNSVRGL